VSFQPKKLQFFPILFYKKYIFIMIPYTKYMKKKEAANYYHSTPNITGRETVQTVSSADIALC